MLCGKITGILHLQAGILHIFGTPAPAAHPARRYVRFSGYTRGLRVIPALRVVPPVREGRLWGGKPQMSPHPHVNYTIKCE